TIQQNHQVIADVDYENAVIGGAGHYYHQYTWVFSYRDLTNANRQEKVQVIESPFLDFLDENFWHFGHDPIPTADQSRCQSACMFRVPILLNNAEPLYFVVVGPPPSFGVWSQTLTILFHQFFAVLLMSLITIVLFVYVRPAFKALVGEQGSDRSRGDEGMEVF